VKRVRFGSFEADLQSGELFRGAQRVALQRQPFQLLAVLLEKSGELVTRDELRVRLWPHGTVVDFEHSLNTAVRKLRRALADSCERPVFIETLNGRGYRLRVSLEDSEAGDLRRLAVTLRDELVEDPEGEIAMLLAALFVTSEDAFRRGLAFRRRAMTR
jgi:DNA-binding winged helix-turn-helix (wHTH) protein